MTTESQEEPVTAEAGENEQPAAELAGQLAEETPSPEAEAKPREPSDQIKVVIVMKTENILIGVTSPDCDPVYKTLKGTMALALKQVPGLIKEANRQWDEHPLYPKANLPTPEPAPTPARTSARVQAPTKPKQQPSFF